MPNWVSNDLTIEGNPELVIKLKEQVGKSYVYPIENNGDLAYSIVEKTVNSPFSFWNVIAPTDMEAYHSQPIFDKENPLWSGNDWYNWNSREWGSKWDTSNAELVSEQTNGDNLVLVYSYETAWSPATEVLKKLSAQYPELLFTLEFEEEQGWGGTNEYLRGIETELSEYDEKCWECDEINNMGYCEECDINVCLACKMTREGEECGHDVDE